MSGERDLTTLLSDLRPELRPDAYVFTTAPTPPPGARPVATRLAASGISRNVIAGYHHDHLFVPWERASEAIGLLGQSPR